MIGLGVASCTASLSTLDISEIAQQPIVRSEPQWRSKVRYAGQVGVHSLELQPDSWRVLPATPPLVTPNITYHWSSTHIV